MATKMLGQAVMYLGRTYGPGEVETDDMVEGADEAFEEKGFYVDGEGSGGRYHSTDPSDSDPGQPGRNPPPGEPGEEDMHEAPPAGRAIDSRPMLPGAIAFDAESDEDESDEPKPRARGRATMPTPPTASSQERPASTRSSEE